MGRKIAICDDNKIMLRQIAGYLEQLQETWEEELIPSYFSSGEELLDHLTSDTALLLLDISMGAMNGMECARRIRSKGWDLPIVFITSLQEYSLEGYQVHAFGFLVKPVTYTEFSGIVTEALRSREVRNPVTIPVHTAEGVCLINPDQLLYAEVFRHDTSFVLESGRIESNVQLSAMEPYLLPHGFFRCHRSFLVSLSRVAFIGKDTLTMSNGDTVPLSKHRRREFLEAYSNYMGVRI